MVFSFRCNYQRGRGDVGLESKQWFYAAMAVTSGNRGLRDCFLLLVAYITHDAGWDGIRYLVRNRYCACYAYCLARFWAIARYSRYYRPDAHHHGCNHLASIFQVGDTALAV